jgi:hypothetical protein
VIFFAIEKNLNAYRKKFYMNIHPASQALKARGCSGNCPATRVFGCPGCCAFFAVGGARFSEKSALPRN